MQRMLTLKELDFESISTEEYMEKIQEERMKFRPLRQQVNQISRRGPGRPRKDPSTVRLLQALIAVEDLHEGIKGGDQSTENSKRPAKDQNWFSESLWPPLELALKHANLRPSEAISFLKKKYGTNPHLNPYLSLNESTVRGWFWWDESKSRKTLKPRYQSAVDLLGAGYSGKQVNGWLHPGASKMWAEHKELELEFMSLIKSLRETDVMFNSRLIQFQMKAFVMVKCPELLKENLEENGGRFEVSRNYIRHWVQTRMGWSFRKHTTPGVQLVPAGQDRTYAVSGSKNVSISGAGDKRQITVMVSSSVKGYMLPQQVIFQGKTSRSCPGGAAAKTLCQNGFQLTASPSHWTTQATIRDFVTFVLKPWITSTCADLQLNPNTQKAIWVIDAYSVHVAEEFRSWMREKHSNILLLFIPALCTSKLQPADTILMRPFKAGIQRKFSFWAVEEIKKQMEQGMSTSAATLDTSIVPLRNNFCDWLFSVYSEMCFMHRKIRDGWMKIGFHDAWQHEIQIEAAVLNAQGKLFSGKPVPETSEGLPLLDTSWYGDMTVEQAMSQEVDPFRDQVSNEEEEILTSCPRISVVEVIEARPDPVVPPVDMPIPILPPRQNKRTRHSTHEPVVIDSQAAVKNPPIFNFSGTHTIQSKIDFTRYLSDPVVTSPYM
ncbi:hypothetical protein R1sor_021390 [Riccia sorocarpa]|uniref:DDE-1 domain-containing protein n=1 Tax=Riccia sorocarpa TaxID=122646 RepID=A0ABD3GJ38_9MARC